MPDAYPVYLELGWKHCVSSVSRVSDPETHYPAHQTDRQTLTPSAAGSVPHSPSAQLRANSVSVAALAANDSTADDPNPAADCTVHPAMQCSVSQAVVMEYSAGKPTDRETRGDQPVSMIGTSPHSASGPPTSGRSRLTETHASHRPKIFFAGAPPPLPRPSPRAG